MRLSILTAALALAIAPAAAAKPADFVAPAPARAFHPVDADRVGYGEWAARYGNFRHGHVHAGQDVFAPAGTPLRAVRDGVIVEKGDDGGRGNYIAIHSAAERETYVYFHMLAPSRFSVGDAVAAGERVGRVGCTGSCFGDHLHFEIRRGRGTTGETRDPLPWLRALARQDG